METTYYSGIDLHVRGQHYSKRLEQGTFELPGKADNRPLTWNELVFMLEGIAMASVRYRKRYAAPEMTTN